MPRHIFTYGSLMFAPVWRRVVRGYGRYAIAGKIYPAMIAQPDAAVNGIVYFDVDDVDAAALDVFEGAEHRRVSMSATLNKQDAENFQVESYGYVDEPMLTHVPWEPEAFQLDRFLNDYC